SLFRPPPPSTLLPYTTLFRSGLDTSDPHRHTGSIAVQQLYVEALTSIGPDGGVEAFLAEGWEISEDGRTYSFTLRDGVTFHNGRSEEHTSELQSRFDLVCRLL